MEEAVREHARDEFSEDVWDELAEATYYVPTEFEDDDERGPRRAAARTSSTASAAPEGNRLYYLAVPPKAIANARRGDRRAAHDRRLDAADRREAVRPRPRVGARAERGACAGTSTSARSSGSTTTSARRPCRTCSRSGSRTGSSSRSGRASTSTTCRSRSPSRSGSRAAPRSTSRRARRDILQNHLLQLLALTAMEPPIDFDADAVRNEKAKVLRATQVDAVVRGQYGRGYVEGEEVPGYREEEGVDPESTTETFVAAKLADRQLALGRHAVLRAGRASGCRGARRRSRSSSSACRTRSSRTPTGCARTCSRSTSSPTRASRSASARRCPARG